MDRDARKEALLTIAKALKIARYWHEKRDDCDERECNTCSALRSIETSVGVLSK
jgi:hypothetical protein